MAAARLCIHYLACDREGNAAIFEYLNGELIVYCSGDTLPVKALANSSYADSLRVLQGEQPMPDAATESYQHNSLQRFARVAQRL